jgi:hypothetical protein
MAPLNLIDEGWSASEIANRFGLSGEAASIRLQEFEKHLGKPRPLPKSAIDYLKEAAERGYKPRTDLS